MVLMQRRHYCVAGPGFIEVTRRQDGLAGWPLWKQLERQGYQVRYCSMGVETSAQA